MKKKLKKIISIILVLSITLQSFPTIVYATNVEDKNERHISLGSNKEATIVKEITELREADKKYFLMSNGETMVAFYNDDIHYKNEDGKFEEINTSLSDNTDDFETKSNDYKVKFFKQSNKNKLVRVKKKTLTLDYNNNLLTKITNNIGEFINYGYNGTNLTQITYLDNSKVYYEYNNNVLTKITGADNSKLEYDYYGGLVSRVKTIREYGRDATLGNTINVEYSDYSTRLTDNRELTNVYNFDNFGRSKNVTVQSNNERYGYSYTYTSSNRIKEEFSFIKPVNNYVKSSGKRSMRCNSESNSSNIMTTQTSYLQKGETYMLSFNINTSFTNKANDGGASAIINYYDSSNNIKEQYIT